MTGTEVAVWTLLALLAPMALIAATNLLLAPRLHRLRPAMSGPLVSVLVPARDEAANLRRLLPSLRASHYHRLEVVVLDDGSRDETAAVVRGHAASDPRVRLVEGLDPPGGWTGKNWACHQLARRARGDLLLFCDADVVPGGDAVGRTVAALSRDGTDVTTAFPRHERGGWFEEAVIPLVAKLPVAALLPLPLVRRTRTASLAVGNGQWLAWRRDAYHRLGGHARVRDDVLEDVRLARIAKRAGLGVAPYLGTRDLTVRMYRDTGGTWRGFVKNAYLLAGGSDMTALPVLVLYTAVLAGPLLLPLAPAAGLLAWAPLVVLLITRILAAALFRDRPASVALHPVGVAAVAALVLASRHRHHRGTVEWKRRILTMEKP